VNVFGTQSAWKAATSRRLSVSLCVGRTASQRYQHAGALLPPPPTLLLLLLLYGECRLTVEMFSCSINQLLLLMLLLYE